MKPWFATVLVGLAIAGGIRGEEAFSQAIRPEDFAAAELAKLSPAALTRLDELVQAYKSGAVARAKAEAAAAAAEVAAAREKAQAAQEKSASPGFFAKAKVMLTPGTKVEYGEIESTIVGNFTGWEPRTVFRLENGQMWKVANGDSYSTPAISNPKARIYPAAMGGFWLKIDGINPRVKVLPL